MALREFWCPKCNSDEEHIVFNEEEEKNLRCEKCKGKVMRKMSVSNFEIRGFSASNGYSKEKKK